MNKKILISGGIAAFIMGTIVGLYYYTKKSINKIAVAMDDTFNIENDNNTIQFQIDLTKTNKNGSSCTKNAFIPKEEEKNQKETIKIHNFKFDDCYKHIKPLSIQEEIEKALKEKCDECPCKKNETDKMYDPAFQYLFDDKFYKDFINTCNIYEDDGK